jgi:hypothetical protein
VLRWYVYKNLLIFDRPTSIILDNDKSDLSYFKRL